MELQDIEIDEEKDSTVHYVDTEEDRGIDQDSIHILYTEIHYTLASLKPCVQACLRDYIKCWEYLILGVIANFIRINERSTGDDHIFSPLEIKETKENKHIILEEYAYHYNIFNNSKCCC